MNSNGDIEFWVLYLALVIGSCFFFGILYVGIYSVLMLFEVIPQTIYKIWKEILRNERNTRNKQNRSGRDT